MPQTTTAPSFTDLLRSAITEPGHVSAAYFAFHNYSLGNQLLALFQCHARGIPTGPIATFPRWKELRRYVRKGEKAIELCMPVTCKRTTTNDETGESDDATFTRFVLRRNWFVLAQTDGEPYLPPAPPAWDKTRALAALDITETPFDLMDGNCQGYARGRSIAVSPIAVSPFKTLIHEAAHVLHGHTTEARMQDSDITPRDLREVEAEAVAYILIATLTPNDAETLSASRGYLQHWMQDRDAIPEASARKIFKVADQILRAGRESAEGQAR